MITAGIQAFIIFLISFLLSAAAFGVERSFQVLEMDQEGEYSFQEVTLFDLVSDNSFEGTYFKIVRGKSDDAISFDDLELSSKAANVYHHLSKARVFWARNLGERRLDRLGQMTVRLEITNDFSRLGHFKADDRKKIYNDAFTVPAGKTPSWVPKDKQDEWGFEIWFSPMKEIEATSLSENGGVNPLERQISLLQGPVVDYTVDSFNRSLLSHIFYPDYQDGSLLDSAVRHAGTLALTYAMVEGSKRMDKMFMEDTYYLDTAMVPEVIYHEYAHAVMSEELEPTHANAVSEGIADYFAARVSGNEVLYKKIKSFSNNLEKDAKNRELYQPGMENPWNATGDFALSVLWRVREALSKPIISRRTGENFTDRLILEAASELETNKASINKELPRALMNACRKVCPTGAKRLVLQAMLKTFLEKGL